MNKKFIGVLLGVLLVIYFGLSIYFTKHFYFGSNINGINVTGKTVEEVEKQMKANVNEYTLNLKEPGGKNEQIKATDIGLNYDSEGQVQGLKDNQNPFGWVIALFNTKNSEMTNKVSYDKKLLIECLDKSSFLTSGDVTESKNPSIKYTDKGYVIVNEVEGTKVNKDMLYTQLETEIVKGKTTTDLDVINCFAKPQYTSNSPEIIEAKNILNKYVNSKITYTFGNRKEVLDGSTINKWLKVSEDFKVTLDEAKSQKYLNELSTTYSTVEKTHDFVTTAGKSIQVKGGDYGWKINVTKEIQALIKTIKEGQTIAKEPAYTQTALSHDKNDIGKTYVEVDMSRQHLWFYKNGSLVVQGDIVTGDITNGHTTPEGVYRLKSKEKDKALRGPGYEEGIHVTYWMPFNNGIGLHDATWKSKFGGVVYKGNGSHGCVNCPLDLAKTIYNSIDVNTPVVCFK